MSATTVRSAQIGLMYGDGDTRTYTFKEVPETLTTADMKTAIAAINASLSANTAGDFKSTFMSDAGYNVTKIDNAKLIEEIEEVVYSG